MCNKNNFRQEFLNMIYICSSCMPIHTCASFLCSNVCLQPFVGTTAVPSESIPKVTRIVNTWCQRHNPKDPRRNFPQYESITRLRCLSVMHSHPSGDHDMPGGPPDLAKKLMQSVFWSVTACLILAQWGDGMKAGSLTDWLPVTADFNFGVIMCRENICAELK